MNFWKGKNIRLRGVEPSDAEAFFAWNLDTDMARNLEFIWPPVSMAHIRDWAEKQSLKELEHDSFVWMIENNEGAAVGSIRTHNCIPRYGTFSYGVFVSLEHQRNNHAFEAVSIILRYYFHELRYQKATVTVNAYNAESIALHEKLGFRKEGTIRRMFCTAGEYHDVHWFGMTKEEWETELR